MKVLLIALLLIMLGCAQETPLVEQNVLKAQEKELPMPKQFRYAAIGDSYTAGTGATPSESFPSVLTERLRSEGVDIVLVANLGVNGWTTHEALELELPDFRSARPNMATLLIGANDFVRGTSPEEFSERFSLVLDEMLKVVEKEYVVVFTIPDFSITPVGVAYEGDINLTKGIEEFNKVIVQESEKRGVRVIDLYPLSKKAKDDKSLLAPDGLHPSAKGYAQWVDYMYADIKEMLKK